MLVVASQLYLPVLSLLKGMTVETQLAFPLRARTLGIRVRLPDIKSPRLALVRSRESETMALAIAICSAA